MFFKLGCLNRILLGVWENDMWCNDVEKKLEFFLKFWGYGEEIEKMKKYLCKFWIWKFMEMIKI